MFSDLVFVSVDGALPPLSGSKFNFQIVYCLWDGRHNIGSMAPFEKVTHALMDHKFHFCFRLARYGRRSCIVI